MTGAGPIGLLAALMGGLRGFDVHVLDRVTSGPKPQLVRDLGASYHAGELPNPSVLAPDIVIECTRAPSVVLDAISRTAASGIACLAGISSGQHRIDIEVAAVNRSMVIENDAVFGSVNANRGHYESAGEILAGADREWRSRLISRQVPATRWQDAFDRQPDDVKVVVNFAS